MPLGESTDPVLAPSMWREDWQRRPKQQQQDGGPLRVLPLLGLSHRTQAAPASSLPLPMLCCYLVDLFASRGGPMGDQKQAQRRAAGLADRGWAWKNWRRTNTHLPHRAT